MDLCWRIGRRVGGSRALAQSPPQGGAMSQSRLEHAYLSVKDLDRSLSFYRRILPDWVIRWEGKKEDGRWVHLGPPGDGQPGYLSLAEQPDAAPFESYTALGPQHIGFAHPDVDGLIASLEPS